MSEIPGGPPPPQLVDQYGRPIERPPEQLTDEPLAGAESAAPAPELDISEIPPEVRFLFEDEAKRSEREDWSGQLARAIIQGAPDGEAYREPAKKLGLTDADFDQKIKELTEFNSEAPAWLEGGTEEQRNSVLEASLSLLAESRVDRQLFQALVTKISFAPQPIEKPAHYTGAKGKVLCVTDPETGRIEFSQDFDPSDPELRHGLAHELGHLAESAIDYDDQYQKLVRDRPACLDSYYVRNILDSISEEERGTPVEDQKRAAAGQERFAEDYALFLQSRSEEDFLRERLERARETDLEAYFGDTKTAGELIRLLQEKNPSHLSLEANEKKLAPFDQLIEENRKLFRFFEERTEAIRGLDRQALQKYVKDKTGEEREKKPPMVDLEGLVNRKKSGEKKDKSKWFDLLLLVIGLNFDFKFGPATKEEHHG